jgi:Tfp pilus assembly protein PilW
MSNEQGFTLIELLVGIASFIVLLGAIMMMTVVATRNQERITDRVSANQRARPAMTQIMDALHSACYAPRATPVQSGSNNTSVTFWSKAGSQVTPVPDQKQVFLTGGNLDMRTWAGLPGGGFSPTFTTRRLATRVTAPGNVVFRYYAYVNGQLSQQATPLTSTTAPQTARVAVSFAVAPSEGVTSTSLDQKSPITLSDAADLRLEPAAQVTTQENPPCT